MRRYRDHMDRRDAPGQRALFAAHVDRVSAEIAALEVRRSYLAEKVALWSAREVGDVAAEGRAVERLRELAGQL